MLVGGIAQELIVQCDSGTRRDPPGGGAIKEQVGSLELEGPERGSHLALDGRAK